MKIRTLHNNLDLNNLIIRATNKERVAQNELYHRFSSKMLSVCRMYTKDLQHAEDVMVRGFFKAFQNLDTYKNIGSFEGWLRRIMTREAIDFIRGHKALDFPEDFDYTLAKSETQSIKHIDKQHNHDFLQWCIDQLPNGYRVVFVLYGVEGYSHKEIALKLGISEGTSKSQLYKARKLLQKMVKIEDKGVSYGK